MQVQALTSTRQVQATQYRQHSFYVPIQALSQASTVHVAPTFSCASAGADLNKTSTGNTVAAANPPLFHAPAGALTSPERTAGPTTAVEGVQPHNRQSATAAAEAMLRHGSPLSGLHKLALSICARKKGSPGSALPLAQTAPVLAKDKENVSPLEKRQQVKTAGKHTIHFAVSTHASRMRYWLQYTCSGSVALIHVLVCALAYWAPLQSRRIPAESMHCTFTSTHICLTCLHWENSYKGIIAHGCSFI